MKTKREYGTGSITKKGYIRISGDFKHRRVWRKHFGPVPQGFFIHHKNGDKQDNRIENLELVDALTHKRLHSNCELRDGQWWKKCPKCNEWKPIDRKHWYFTKEGWVAYNRCRPCHIRIVCEKKKQKRKQRQK